MSNKIPHNLEAERMLLGTLLTFPYQTDAVFVLLRSEDFYKPQHAAVYAAILQQREHGNPVDAVSMVAALESMGTTMNRAEIVALANEAGITTHATAHAHIIVEAAARRRLMTVGGDITSAAKDPETPLADVLGLARTAVERADLPMGGTPDQNIDEFVEQDNAYDWLVGPTEEGGLGLVERMDRILLVAEEGAGKSILLRQFGIMVSQGIHPFAQVAMAPKRVMIIDLENPPRLAARKMESIRNKTIDFCVANNITYDPERCRVIMKPEGLDITKRGDAMWLTERVAANRPDLLCIGPLYKLHEAEDEKSSEVRQVQITLDRIRVRYECALLMETHAPHESFTKFGKIRPSGSRLWIRWPEFILTLSPMEPGLTEHWWLNHARGPRDERNWPKGLKRGTSFPWVPMVPGIIAK